MTISMADIALDIAILSLPIPIIKSLNLSRRKKVTLICTFWLGGFCVVATAVRSYFTYETTSKRLGPESSLEVVSKFSYDSASNILWGVIQPTMSIVTACLPTYGPLVRHDWWKQSSSNQRTKHSSTGNATTDSIQLPAAAGNWERLPSRRGLHSPTDRKRKQDFRIYETTSPSVEKWGREVHHSGRSTRLRRKSHRTRTVVCQVMRGRIIFQRQKIFLSSTDLINIDNDGRQDPKRSISLDP